MTRRPLNRIWTEADEQLLREMAAKKKSLNLIAARLGRNLGTVRNRAYMLGVKIETIPEARKRLGIKRGEGLR